MSMMTLLLGLVLAASPAPAAEVASTAPSDTVTTAAVGPAPMLVIPLASFDNPSVQNVHPDQCRFRKGQGQVWMEINRGEAMSFYGGAFPDDLVDVEKPLREGFRNQEKVVVNEVTLTWTAVFEKGVLKIDGESKGGGLPSQRQHFEFRTKSSVKAADEASWRMSTPELSDEAVTVRCAEVPMA